MSEQETIADIIAEMRQRAKRPDFVSQDVLKDFADELDAAHKRERGDSAKLREACEALVSDIGGYSTDGLEVIWCRISGETIRKARAALAAPPRNCDRYATVDEAMDDFADEALIEEWNALKAGKDRDMLAVELFVFTKWLFALSTEQEGGNNANK